MNASFVINARNKEKLVGRCVQAALAQTYPCEILISDQASTDGTLAEIESAVAKAGETKHKVQVLRCPIEGAYGMQASNEHFQWLTEQASGEWIFQCSADDYSLPDRVAVCMKAYEDMKRDGKSAACIATNMQMLDPAAPKEQKYAGMAESSYISGGFGIKNLVFGSCIGAYRRDWLLKVGLNGVTCTADVYLGFLAAVSDGYYVVANPQHVHYMAADMQNMGFQGKMRAAEASGDEDAMDRINELNRFQLFELYFKTKIRQQELYPLAHQEDQSALIQMMLAQATGWYQERSKLHKKRLTPWIM